MIPRFINSNLYWRSIKDFEEQDKHLRDLKSKELIYQFKWPDEVQGVGVYILSGARQLGKSTSIKQDILKKLKVDKVKKEQIFYLACDRLSDRQDLYQAILSYYNLVGTDRSYLYLDEVTFIKSWELSIKALIDEGFFYNSEVVITGSDNIILEDAGGSFPGIDRRKNGKNIDVHPLSFGEYLKLVNPNYELDYYQNNPKDLLKPFENYLETGGILAAINNFHDRKDVSDSLLDIYLQWIISSFLKKGKSKRKLIDLLSVIYPRISSQITYSKLAEKTVDLSVDTLIEYCEILERLGFIKTFYSVDFSKKKASPKKAKKIHFADPLFSKVCNLLLRNEGLIDEKQKIENSILVEGLVALEYSRKYKTYYYKSKQEIDLVVLKSGKLFPIEVKWGKSVSTKQLAELSKYKNSVILRKEFSEGQVGNVPSRNLIIELLKLDKDINN